MMIDGDTTADARTITATPLDKSIERYNNALTELESAVQNPSFEQIVEVLVARDVVEKKRVEDENPSGKNIAKLIQLDSRLKAQSKAIANHETLDQAKEFLSQDTWWWQLTDPEAVPNKAIECYEQALSDLESAQTNPLPQQIRTLLLARDVVERIRTEEKEPSQERIDRIMELDDRLWAQAGAIAKEEKVYEWKVHFNPPASNWWWQITTESPYFSQCVDRYEKALEEVKENSPQRNYKL